MNKINKILIGMDSFLIILLVGIFIWSRFFGEPHTTYIQTTNTNIEKDNQKRATYTIGLSLFNRNQEYFERIEEGVRAKAEELGIDIIVHDQKSSTIEMTTGVSALLEEDIDALLISPYNPEAMGTIVSQAKEKGIPVIVIDIGAGGTDVNALILSDSFGGGVLAGEYALKLIEEHNIKSKNVGVIQVKESSVYGRERGEGFANVMKDYGYHVLDFLDGNSDRQTAYNAAKSLVETYDDNLAVIFVENDEMALGVAQAVDEAGEKGKIMVIGFNGDPSAIEAIKDGSMQGTIAQLPFQKGELGTELAYTLLTGGTITYDDMQKKELYVEIYLINEKGEAEKSN